MVLQNYQNLIEMTSNMIYIVAFIDGFKCLRKIHLNTQWGGAFRLTSPEFEDKVKMTERGKLLLLAPPPLDPNYFRGLRLT